MVSEEEVAAADVTGPLEYRYASGAEATRPARMVYLDFFQVDPRTPADNPRVSAVARVVMHADHIPALIESLQAVVDGGA